jgi:CIC family chloride channel protein
LSQEANFRNLLSRNDAKLFLAGLALLVGILAGLIVSLFRFILENGFPFISNGLAAESFESLSPVSRFLFPVIGCILISIIFHFFRPQSGSMGVSYVINKVHNFRGHMPIKNAALQFIGAILALLSGCSCGREGPAIHIGAASGSSMGHWLNLPNNSIRTLIACGSAAAISASFDTPIAGVIFAMEVIMMEYVISSFIPVIVASVSAAVITQILYGGDSIFDITSISMTSLWEIPYVAFIGILLGVLASIFVRLHKFASSYNHIDQRIRFLGIGLLTGVVALFVPEIMGMGYDTINLALQSNLAINFLLLVLLAKLVVTSVGLGLGLPGGVIGPTIMMGGIAGAIMGSFGTLFFPGDPAFYVLLGMCAMMGATLQAPLAALMALLELSNNPNIILPAMIVIVVANLTFSEILKSKSVFLNSKDESKKYNKELSRFLNRYGVSSLISDDFVIIRPDMEIQKLEDQLKEMTRWVIIDHDEERKTLIERSNLNQENLKESLNHTEQNPQMVAIHHLATLEEALETMQEAELRYGYIYSGKIDQPHITGIISIDDIISFYRD